MHGSAATAVATRYVLETERLRLRRFRPGDLDTLHRWHTDADFMRHMGRPSLTREESAQALERYEAHWREHGFGLLAAEEKRTGALVGRVGPAYHAAWPHDPETGWAIDPSRWGRGLATEAGAECVRWALEDLGFHRVVSICIEENVASRRVMEKLGFRLLTWTVDERFGLTLLVHALDAA